jgi:hypothetical protein
VREGAPRCWGILVASWFWKLHENSPLLTLRVLAVTCRVLAWFSSPLLLPLSVVADPYNGVFPLLLSHTLSLDLGLMILVSCSLSLNHQDNQVLWVPLASGCGCTPRFLLPSMSYRPGRITHDIHLKPNSWLSSSLQTPYQLITSSYIAAKLFAFYKSQPAKQLTPIPLLHSPC